VGINVGAHQCKAGHRKADGDAIDLFEWWHLSKHIRVVRGDRVKTV
jgi:hypothetical protein